MKEIKYIFLLGLTLMLGSCQKEEIMMYQQRAGVYFSTRSMAYSFTENPGVDTARLRLPVDITGSPVDYRREFKVTLPDFNPWTTAEEDQYKIGQGYVEAGEETGYVELELYKDERLLDSVYTLHLAIQKTPDFPEIRLNRFDMEITFTDKLIQPANWGYLNLGTFSSAWWRFVLNVTNGNPLRYWGGVNPDKDYWTMGYSELAVWRTVIRRELKKYNEPPEGPLVHDDGPSKGKPVEMPIN